MNDDHSTKAESEDAFFAKWAMTATSLLATIVIASFTVVIALVTLENSRIARAMLLVQEEPYLEAYISGEANEVINLKVENAGRIEVVDVKAHERAYVTTQRFDKMDRVGGIQAIYTTKAPAIQPGQSISLKIGAVPQVAEFRRRLKSDRRLVPVLELRLRYRHAVSRRSFQKNLTFLYLAGSDGYKWMEASDEVIEIIKHMAR